MSDIKSLLNDFINDKKKEKELKEWAENASNEEITEALRAMKKHGPSINENDEKKTVSFSYTNYTMEFAKHYTLTSMIAYLFRALREYKTPEEVKPCDISKYMVDPSIADPPENIKDERLLKLYGENKNIMDEKVIIYKFLYEMFNFNPDLHVRSSFTPNKKDSERKLPNTKSAKLAVEKGNTIKKEQKKDYDVSPSDLNYSPTGDIEIDCFNNIPPADFFNKYTNFVEDHHEKFLKITQDIHGTRHDIDFAIKIYDKHSKVEADKFRKKYRRDFDAAVSNVDIGRWALLGPYRENKARVDFYNEHTEVLKQMLDKRKKDEKLATDIMKKKIKIKKKKNIEEYGEDDDDVKEYFKNNKPNIAHMGGEHVTIDEDNEECPDDAVEVTVYNIEDGGSKMTSHKIFNPMEAPDECVNKDENDDKKDDEIK